MIDITDIEIELARHLAEVWARDPEVLRIVDEIMKLERDDEAFEIFEEGLIDLALDKILEREAAFGRPCTPLEMLVDRACDIVR